MPAQSVSELDLRRAAERDVFALRDARAERREARAERLLVSRQQLVLLPARAADQQVDTPFAERHDRERSCTPERLCALDGAARQGERNDFQRADERPDGDHAMGGWRSQRDAGDGIELLQQRQTQAY